jgi:uncharacterized protein (TIGR02271 family)
MADTPPEDPVIPLHAEHLTVEVARRVTGRVRLRLETLTEDAPVTAELAGERVEVTRIPIGREVAEAPTIRVEGAVTIVPVLEEVLVVERRLFLREEVHLTRIPDTETVETTVPLRRQRVVVERDESERTDEPPTEKERSDD